MSVGGSVGGAMTTIVTLITYRATSGFALVDATHRWP